MTINLDNYSKFVDGVTSMPSKDTETLKARLDELVSLGCDPARLSTAGIGLSSESGEFNEIVKKILFQGKEYNNESQFHMKRELGDIFFYWTLACLALGISPYDVIAENENKLSKRYPGGFTVAKSENRAQGDL